MRANKYQRDPDLDSALSVRQLLAITLLLMSLTPALHAECVILLHGLTRSSSSFSKLQTVLEQNNYVVVNQGYPSTKNTVENLSVTAINAALEKCAKDAPVSFVTHSLGGILVRYYLSENKLPNLKSVVMLAPPNQGSEVVDKLGGWKMFSWLNGPAGAQLGTDEESVARQLGDADYSLGVIAGSKSINLILSLLIPGVDDGKVSIERTKLAGMSDHIVVSVSHPFIMKNNEVIEQVLYFLQNSRFEKSAE